MMPGGHAIYRQASERLEAIGIVTTGGGFAWADRAGIALDLQYEPAKYLVWRRDTGWALVIKQPDGESLQRAIGPPGTTPRAAAAAVPMLLVKVLAERAQQLSRAEQAEAMAGRQARAQLHQERLERAAFAMRAQTALAYWQSLADTATREAAAACTARDVARARSSGGAVEITPTVAAHVLAHFGAGGMEAGPFTRDLILLLTRADPANWRLRRAEFPAYDEAVRLVLGAEDGITRLRAIAGEPVREVRQC
jgi:hypothetical protein